MSSLDKIITSFQLLYQEIIDINDNTGLNPIEKWTKIATLMHDKNDIIVKTFMALKHESSRGEISLDYNIDAAQLRQQIESEADYVVKSSLIITSLHLALYTLLSTEGNYYFSLDGQEEMHVLKKKLIYYINLSAKNEQNIFFHAFILLYGLESLFNRHFYVGIDFEYTRKKIQLAQLNFEHNVALQSIIMMVSPNELEPVMMDNFVKIIICNKYIKKILHGSDSLDILYMYEHMLGNDPNKIIRFTRTLIDTRFLCEYYKLNLNQESDNKCSIYDEDKNRSAVYYFGVINEKKQEDLATILENMGPHQDVEWNIHKMPKSQVLYAQYDVIFLKYFYYRIIHVATLEEKDDLGKKSVIELYKHVLYELTQFVYLERRDITFVTAKCKEEIDPVNNYMIRKPNEILKLIDVFNQVSIGLTTVDPKTDIDKIIKVNYFKGSIITIIKKMIYTIISRKCRVYKDKTTLWTDKLDNKFIFDFLQKMNYHYLYRMFKELEGLLESKIKALCQ